MSGEWIPVTERLPDQYEIVMVGWAGRRDIGKGYLHHGKWRDPLVCKPDANQPTHWMPLPAPPADDKYSANTQDQRRRRGDEP